MTLSEFSENTRYAKDIISLGTSGCVMQLTNSLEMCIRDSSTTDFNPSFTDAVLTSLLSVKPDGIGEKLKLTDILESIIPRSM